MFAELNYVWCGLFCSALMIAPAGCDGGRGGGSPDGGTDVDAGTVVGGADAAAAYQEPYWFIAQYRFAYDATTDQARAYDFVDEQGVRQTLQPNAVIALHANVANTPGADPICVIQVQSPGSLPRQALQTQNEQRQTIDDSEVVLGFKWDMATAVIDHDCEGKLDPAIWGSVVDAVRTVTWGAGVTGSCPRAPCTHPDATLWTDLESAVNQNGLNWGADWEPYVWGARPYLDTTGTVFGSMGEPAAEFYFGTTVAVDAQDGFLLQWDDANDNGVWEREELPVLIERANLSLGSGFYFIRGLFFLNFGTGLDTVLISSGG